jgi:Restriction endonuclease
MFTKNNAVTDWKDLQDKVAQLFSELGCEVKTPHVVELAGRGKKEVDVFVCDRRTSLEMKTLVECKWWNTEVPQDTIHAFHTVMQGCGANAGFVISKVGFQKGAYEAAQSTNISLLTFEQLQHRFGNEWFFVQKTKVSILLQPLREALNLYWDQFNPAPISNKMFFHTRELEERLFTLHVWCSVLLGESNSSWPESYLGPEPVNMARDPLKPFLDVPRGKMWHEAPTVRDFYSRLIKGLEAWAKALKRLSEAAHKSFDALPPEKQAQLMNQSLVAVLEENPLRALKRKIPEDEYKRLLNLFLPQ